MNNFWRAYLRNLAILALVVIGVAIFAAIFYPDTLSIFFNMGQMYSALKLWPIIIVAIFLFALPHKRR